MPERALVFVNGTIPEREVLEGVLSSVELVVCTDGAANALRKLDVDPDVIIGDLDSLTTESYKYFKEKAEIIEEGSQYSTDLEKALGYILERGFKQVVLTGVKGGRIDHTATNLNILHKRSNELELICFDEDGYGIFVDAERFARTIQIADVPKHTIVSLLSFTEARGVQTSGLNYPLQNEDLRWGVRDGQSNFMSGTEAQVSIKAGSLFVFVCHSGWYNQGALPWKKISG